MSQFTRQWELQAEDVVLLAEVSQDYPFRSLASQTPLQY